MLVAGGVFDALNAGFAFDTEVAFRDFVRSTHATKWIIAADFVTTGLERVNDAFAFTVHPHDRGDFFQMLADEASAIPRDIKRVKTIHSTTAAYLADRRRFHLCFVPNMDRHLLGSLANSREGIAEVISHVEGWTGSKTRAHFLQKLETLRQEARAKRFNFRLLHDVTLLGVLAAYIAFLIAKHSRMELVSWFFDRDNMTTAFGGIVYDMANLNFTSICGMEALDASRIVVSRAVDLDSHSGVAAWYDDLIRAPDYIAGTMARWDFWNNLVSSENPKFVQVIEGAISENRNMAVFTMNFGIFGATCSRVRVFHRHGTNRDAYIHRPGVMADYLAARITRPFRRSHVAFKTGIKRASSLNNVNLRLWWRF